MGEGLRVYSGSGSSTGGPKKTKTVNIFLGFFFVVNFCLGTGFLGVPYAFFYSGYLAAIPTLLLVSFISWINANYVLEVMARAQALEYFDRVQSPSIVDSDSDQNENPSSLSMNSMRRKQPLFEITVKRKFEVLELCEIFFNKWVKYLYLIVLSIYCFLASWSFSTVAGTSWALNIPFNFSGVVQCESEDEPFHHSALPPVGGCRNAYYFSLFIFAVVVVFLSLLDLKEQAWIQMILGLMRFLTVGAIVVYSLAKIASGKDVCEERHEFEMFNVTRNTSILDIFAKFDAVSWLTAVPVFAYAFILHQGLASLTHPIKQKRYLWYLTTAMFATALCCYMTLGIIVPLWFKASINEAVTLNFGNFVTSDNPLALRILAYYLLLFPSLDVSSAYPLMVHTVVNNIYIIVVGHDTSYPSPIKYRRLDFSLRIGLRLIVAILPILAAFGVANLIFVLKYAGLMGFNICFFFPTILQWRSISVCKARFAPKKFSISGSRNDDERKTLLSASSTSISTKTQSLLSVGGGRGEEKLQYMTPYSSQVLSHPIAVGVVGAVGACLFILTLASLGVHPTAISCGIF